MQEMMEAIIKEIALTPIDVSGGEDRIETIYFGGGTPSLIKSSELSLILEAIRKKTAFAPEIEITLEANPDDLTDGTLAEWKAIGINRLSVGLQSFSDRELSWMNRVHTADEAVQCLDIIRENGFTNFSVDLIYGSPLLGNDEWKKNVELVIEKNIPHLSCYALTVEPKTALHKMIGLKKKEPIDPSKQADQFLLLMDWMKQAGYEHYEISNFAKPGMRSRHNSSYWSGVPYFGFGPSAHSFDGHKRKWNIANNALYLKTIEKGQIPFEEEILTQTQKLNEYTMTALRTMEGLDLEWVASNFGNRNAHKIKEMAIKWEAGEKLTIHNERIILTNGGKLFADGIAADLFL